jgi:cell division protein FtsL
VDLKNKTIAIEVTSIKDKIKANTKKVTQLSRFIEEERKNEKVILIANTYKELALNERMDKKHISDTRARI